MPSRQPRLPKSRRWIWWFAASLSITAGILLLFPQAVHLFSNFNGVKDFSSFHVEKNRLSGPNTNSAAGEPPPSPLKQNQSAQLLVIYTTPYGFEPSELTVPVGEHVLMLRNRTGETAVSYQLKTQAGQLVARIEPPQIGLPNKDTLTIRLPLPAGQYRLFADGQPEWMFQLNVVNQ